MKILDVLKSPDGYNMKYSPETQELLANSRKLCQEYNNTSSENRDGQLRILKQLFGTCNDRTVIQPSFHCDYGFNIHTSGFTLFNYNCVILDTSPVHLGANLFVGPGTTLSCSSHPLLADQRFPDSIIVSKPITIKEGVWIGANVTVCGGVTIGKGTVIAAGSVVTKDIPDGVLAGGIPCKVIREITENDRIDAISLS